MSLRSIRTEFAKLRRQRIVLLALVLVAGVAGLSVLSALSAGTDPGSQSAWNALLAGMSLAFPLIAPLMIAVLASRVVDVEHQGQGWLASATAGVTPGALCRSKLVVLGILLGSAVLAASTLVLLSGFLLGYGPGVPLGTWAAFTLSVLVISLVLAALHVLLAARVENQLVGLGIGVLGTLLAVFASGLPSALAHATPWGYFALAQAADYRGGDIVTLPPAPLGITALALAGCAVFLLITSRFDRQEA